MPPKQESVEDENAQGAESEMPVGMIGHLEETVVIPISMHIHRDPGRK